MKDSEAGPEGLELEGYQVETKSKAAQSKSKKPIRRNCPSGHGDDAACFAFYLFLLAF